MNSQILDSLLNHQGIHKNPPALESDIEALLRHLNAELPEELLELWRNSNGFRIPSLGADLMSVAQTLEFLGDWDAKMESGLLPILDMQTSNYIVVAYREIIPRVAFAPHDGDAKLLYRNFSRFLEVLLDCIEQNVEMESVEDFDDYDNELIDADIFFHETQGDFGDTEPRTAEDQVMAQKLLRSRGGWNLYFAIQLLDETNLTTWAELLETNMYTRWSALERMQHFTNSEIKTILEQDKANFRGFVRELAHAATQAGLEVEGDEQSFLKFNEKALNLQRLFCIRHAPNAIPRIIQWFEDSIAGRDPRTRENNIFVDEF
ncbi:MAG: hypothetical protein RLZZ156_1093 [Deinococcota bacterium]|jgi:hypothetical protein